MRCKSLDNFWTRPVAILSLENGRDGVRTRVPHLRAFRRCGSWILLNDLDYALSRSRINFRHALDQTSSQLVERLCRGRTLFAGKRQRTSGITGLADFGVELYRAEQRNVKLAGGALASAFGEDIHFVSAMRAHEVAHVLD